jgi:hypothetical protein
MTRTDMRRWHVMPQGRDGHAVVESVIDANRFTRMRVIGTFDRQENADLTADALNALHGGDPATARRHFERYAAEHEIEVRYPSPCQPAEKGKAERRHASQERDMAAPPMHDQGLAYAQALAQSVRGGDGETTKDVVERAFGANPDLEVDDLIRSAIIASLDVLMSNDDDAQMVVLHLIIAHFGGRLLALTGAHAAEIRRRILGMQDPT